MVIFDLTAPLSTPSKPAKRSKPLLYPAQETTILSLIPMFLDFATT